MNEIVNFQDTAVVSRDITVITTEIKDICRRAQSILLMYAVEIGMRLEEAKAALPHGKWSEWLANEVQFSQSTANNYMRLYKEYGASQLSFFGSNSQSIVNLPYSKALQLLSVPAEEREKFAEDVGADNLSVSELKKAIAERDNALREREEAEKREKEMGDRLAELQKLADEANERAAEVDKVQAELDKKNESYGKLQKKINTLTEKLKKAESDPDVSEEVREKIRAELEQTLRPEIEAEAKADVKKLESALSAASAEANRATAAEIEAKKQLEEYERKLKLSNADVTAFKTLFESLQDTTVKLISILDRIRENDADIAEKLTKALNTYIESVGK